MQGHKTEGAPAILPLERPGDRLVVAVDVGSEKRMNARSLVEGVVEFVEGLEVANAGQDGVLCVGAV